MALEEERKYDVDPAFVLPELADALPPGARTQALPPVTLTATYFDTPDLRLARAGGSLRYRVGDEPPWTVKLPSGTPGVRHEVSRSGGPDRPPSALLDLVTATVRGQPVRPSVTLRSRRHRLALHAADGDLLAEVADDTVTVLVGPQPQDSFRELEVERAGGGRELLDRVEAILLAAGARAPGPEQFTSKYRRALGPAAARPPELPDAGPLPRAPRAGDVLSAAIRRSVARILTHDPLIRLDQRLPDGDTPVHQMRVGCRRLRSDLRTFGLLLDPQWARQLRRELRWLARKLGAVRDVEVLRERLGRTAADSVDPVDPAAVARIDAHLAAGWRPARQALARALTRQRYLALLDSLLEAATDPPVTALAQASAGEVLPELVSGPWHDFVDGAGGQPGAAALTADATDDQWHAVRVRAKQVRYAVEAVSEAIGAPASKLGRRLSRLQDLLGEHQDAAVAAHTWLRAAQATPADQAVAIAAGRLYERERAAANRIRAAFPDAWHAATRPGLLRWLR